LLPCHGTNERNSPDVMVIGFQEIVPLTAQQIVQTDPEKKFCGSRP
jgi:synaptojanin